MNKRDPIQLDMLYAKASATWFGVAGGSGIYVLNFTQSINILIAWQPRAVVITGMKAVDEDQQMGEIYALQDIIYGGG